MDSTDTQTTTPTALPNIPAPVYMPPSPLDASVQLIEWQQRAVDDAVEQYASGHKGCLIRGGTGLGKMYIKCLVIRKLLERGMLKAPPGSVNPFPVLWLTPKNVKPQTQQVIRDCGLSHVVMVLSYGQIRTSSGTDMFLHYTTELHHGQPEIIPVWYPHMRPALLVCDEIQVLKNADSLQSKVVQYCPDDVMWLGASATPWQRVIDAHCSVLRLQPITPFNRLPVSKDTVVPTLRAIASPKSPSDYSPSTMKRLREALEPYIVELKGVRFKFPTQTKCETIQFTTAAQRQAYEYAYDEYLEALRQRGIHREHGWMKVWVAMQKFQQKAELLRCDQIAQRIVQRVDKKAVIVGSNYVDTLRSVWHHLVKVHKVDRNRISFIVGGQTENERQKHVENFQTGKTDIMLLTMRSGGVGISLHHDRPTTKPRHIILPPTWSAIDLVQALGRGHRLTSMSPTTQEILWYGGTVEDKVKDKVEKKKNCIAKSVTAKEQFITLFEKASSEEEDEFEAEIQRVEAEQQATDNPDMVESEITGEGLSHVSDDEMPAGYW